MIELRPAKYLLGRLAPMDNNDKIPQFNLGAGTYNSTVYLRGDGVWANPLAGAGFVPLTRELTINGVTYDLSANRTWTIDTTSATWGNITGTLSNQTDLQNALNAKENTANKGIPGGYASLAGDGKVPSDQLPSYVDDVIEVANYAALPTVGQTGVIYITLDNNNVYRWAGSVYVQISQPNAVWGSITGTLSNQTDLQNALNAKQDDITLTTTGTSGAATFIGNTLNIPQYSQDLSGYVPYIGATSNVNLGEYGLSAGWIRLDTSPTTYAAGAGGISWNSTDGTADLELLNGVTLQIGQELHFYAKATEVIPNGSAVMFAGVQGDHLLIAKAERTVLNTNPNYFMGVATQDFVNNEFGYVTAFGNVRGLDTTAYSLGAVLYYDSTSVTPGLLTATMPNANLAKIEVAAVVRVHANQGILMVRPHVMPMLNEIQDVNTNLSKTTPVDADSVLLQDTADSNIWKKLSWLNTKATLKTYFDTLYQGVGSYVPTSRTITINSTTQDLSANRSWTIDKASVGLGNVDNTSDLNKPISTATQTALNAKQDNITLTTSGTSGAATLVGATLNIPQYQSVITNPITGTGTTNYVSKFTGSGSIGDSLIFDNGTSVGIGTASPLDKLDVSGYIRMSGTSSASAILGGVSSSWGGDINYPTLYGTSAERWVMHINPHISYVQNAVNGYTGAVNGSTIRFASDTSATTYWDLGIGVNSVGTDKYSLGRAGASFLTVNNSGNVGIGNTNPGAKLDISGDLYVRTGAGTYTNVLSPYSGDLTIALGGSGNDLIVSGGNVGIGTTSPSQLFHVFGRALVDQFEYTRAIDYSSGDLNSLTTAGFYDGSNMANAPEGNTGWFYITVERHNWGSSADWIHQTATTFGSGNTANLVYTRTRTGGTWQNWKRFIDWTDVSGTTNYVSKFTSNNSIGNSLIYDNGTYVGINTTSPNHRLHVVGDLGNWAGFFQSGGASAYLALSNGYGAYIDAGSSATSSTYVLDLVSNGSSRLFVRGDGNVGIGTTSPDTNLDVIGDSLTVGSESTYAFRIRGGGGGKPITISSDGSYAYIQSWSGGPLQINNQGNNTLLNVGGGNVGIGTTSPNLKLHIEGSVNGEEGLRIRNTSSNNGATTMLRINNDSGNSAASQVLMFLNSSTRVSDGGVNTFSIRNNIGSTRLMSAASGTVSFWTSVSDERMTITSGGNVGIGTTAPSQKLDVYGNIKIDSNNAASQLMFYNSGIVLGSIGKGNYAVSGADHTGISMYSVGSMSFGTGGTTERMRITSGGNVGIGITNPTQKLVVDGGASQYITMFAKSSYLVGANYYSSILVGYALVLNQSTQFGYVYNSTTPANSFAHITPYGFAEGSKFVVRADGNVGIGTASPIELMSLYKSTRPYISIQNATTGTTSNDGMFFGHAFGDLDFEIRNKENSAITVWTNNAERMRISSTGNVGIGTTSPSQKLHVNGTVLTTSTLNSTSGSYTIDHPGVNTWKIGITNTNTSTLHIGNDTGGSFVNKALNITNGGNVGIGTTSPNYKTTIYSATTNTDVLCVANNQINPDFSQYFVGISLQDQYANGGGNTSTIRSYSNLYSQWGSTLTFSTTGTGGVGVNERMRITSDGNVGIGTTNPSEKLTVNGNIYASQGGLIAYRTDGGTGLDVNGGDLGSGSYIARFKNYSNVDKVVIKGNGNVSVSGEISSNYGSNRGTLWLGDVVLQDASFTSYGVLDYTLHNGGGYSHIMRVQGNGNVGIGTTTPAAKLDINAYTGIAQIVRQTYTFNGPNYAIGIVGDGASAGYIAQNPANGGLMLSGGTTYYGAGLWRTDTTSGSTISLIDGNTIFLNNGGLSGNYFATERMRISSDGNIGIGTTVPDPSAILDVTSSTQGFLPPRMDNSEINAISNPAEGLIVYSTQSKCLFLFDGASWQKIAYA